MTDLTASPLGRATTYADRYDPRLLFPVSRAPLRAGCWPGPPAPPRPRRNRKRERGGGRRERRVDARGARADHRTEAVERGGHSLEVLPHVAPGRRALIRVTALRRVCEHELVTALDRFDALLEIRARTA